ncbi:MAG TPA: heme-binding protein [Candidatus Binatia bacterium]|jgi:ferredoxin--NADP+ reductase
MPYIITSLCTNDGACVEVCPVACIHTTPGAPQFYIDPEVCIDCEQCEIVCPVDAIFKDVDIPAEHTASIEVNAAFFRQNKAAIGPVPFDTAWEMIRSAHEYAQMVGLAVSVVVVDEAGAPIAVGRMDKAETNSVELAFNKAYTAAAFHMATTELAPQAREPWMRSLMISHRGRMMAMGGAVPILNGVTIVGAIGVAGANRPEQDVLCCRAAMSVWETPGHH